MVMADTVPRRGSDGVKKNLLFIDDDPIVVASLKLLFGRDFNTFDAGNADEGIDLFEKCQPDVVLLDLRLPGRDGLAILRAIRKQDTAIPVIIMTGYATLETAEETLRLGAADYVHKPFDAILLKNKVIELARQPQEKHATLPDEKSLAESLHRLNQLELTETASSSFLHDVASPLTGLLTLTEMLRENVGTGGEMNPAKLRESLEGICTNARYMAALVEHWRAFSEPQTLSQETVLVRDVIDIAISLVKGRAVDRKIRLEAKQNAVNASLRINRFALARVLSNLLQNAIEAVQPQTGWVEIITHQESSRIDIIVRDNGPGIPPALLDHVFEPRVTSKMKNMGLGLYISKEIIHSSGGTLSVRNLSEGAEFTVSMEGNRHGS